MNSAHDHYKKGNLLRTHGHDLAALSEYERALALDPHFLLAKKSADFLRSHLEKIFFSFGKLYISEGKNEDACKEFKQVLKINPLSWRAHVKLCILYREIHDLEKAKSHITQAIQIAPHHASLYAEQGHIEDMEENYSAAYTSYEKALALEPHNKGISKHKELTRKILELSRTFQDNTFSPCDGLEIASLFIEKNMPQMAVKTIKKTLQKFPSDQSLLFTLANIYFSDNRFKMAYRFYIKALSTKSDIISHEELYYRIGMALNGMDERMKAHNAFQNVLTLAPRSRAALRAQAALEEMRAQ
jgi:tetratricopeptide (TPR) repeat protein